MELWIRSQDKKILLKATIIKWENGCLRGATDEDCWYHDLGKYKKERALEVLDEIQNLMQPSMNFIISQHIDFDNDGEGLIGCNILKEEPKIEKISDCIVYEMPKD